MDTDKRGWLFIGVYLCASVVSSSFAFSQTTKPGGEITPPLRRDVPGHRIQLTRGALFVPDFFSADPPKAEVYVWFLGAAWCAEQVFYDAKQNAVLLVTNAATLKKGFPAPAEFLDLLEEVGVALRVAKIT